MFLWLLSQAWSAALYFWQVSLVVIAIALLCIVIGSRGLLRFSWRAWFIVASVYAAPFLIVLWGTLMHFEGARAGGPAWRAYFIGALLLCVALLALLSIWRFAGSRL